MTLGRPTKYKEEYIEQARSIISVMGSTLDELAQIFGVSTSTLCLWMNEYPALSEAIKEARDIYDTHHVERSLRERAIGYSHEEVKHFSHEGIVTDERVVIKHYPPDPTSAIFWLKNRNPKRWRDKQEIEHSGAISITSDEEDL